MLKKLIDTNIFIDRFSDPELYKDIFMSEGLVYLSSVVLMELKAGAHSKEAISAVNELIEFFRRVDRIVIPSIRDYEKAGEIVARLQSSKGYDIVIKFRTSFTQKMVTTSFTHSCKSFILAVP